MFNLHPRCTKVQTPYKDIGLSQPVVYMGEPVQQGHCVALWVGYVSVGAHGRQAVYINLI